MQPWEGDRDSAQMRDMVLPLALVSPARTKGDFEFKRFLGSAFVIGDGNYALTASHVVADVSEHHLVLMQLDSGWQTVFITGIEIHPIEDAALLRLGRPLPPLELALDEIHQSTSYGSMGYPESILHEVVPDDGSPALVRPDLVYFQGYVRRRRSNIEIPGLRGSNFFELSESSGPGTSGSPVWRVRQSDETFGIYIGEMRTEENPPRRIAFATRIDAILNWQPAMLGRPLRTIAKWCSAANGEQTD